LLSHDVRKRVVTKNWMTLFYKWKASKWTAACCLDLSNYVASHSSGSGLQYI